MWTAADIPDQTGRTFVVTGANSGLGLATTAALTKAGADVVMACRSVAKAEAARDTMPEQQRARTVVVEIDLADIESVRRCAAGLQSRRIDVLINNAGVMNTPFSRTPQGREVQFGTNVVGHFALTQALVPVLGDRVVWLGSLMHKYSRIDLTDLDWQRRRYNTVRAYADSKLACIMVAYEQQRRWIREGSLLRSMAAHPGYAATNLQTRTNNVVADTAMRIANWLPGVAQSAERGALPELYAATVPDLPGGSYIGPNGPGGTRGYPMPVASSAHSHDRQGAAALWQLCEDMVAGAP